ncbi:MAG: PilT/PilU family type 4a pilus ATPase [Verrucomicrobia bacterium]|nr:PilT/PilU family type 4a pilus ATPase [Verrucomicrobiota bacterium]
MNKEHFNDLLIAMVLCEDGISDLLFIPGRVPQMSCYGRLRSYTSGLITEPVNAEMTGQLAEIIMDGNALVAENYRKNGSCDCSYAVPGVARFRVNIYSQAGHRAIVMRKLSNAVPQLEDLKVPPVFEKIINETAGLVFLTGATGTGKTTTLAAILNEINRTQDIHVITLEDPIEYVHEPIRASFSQREYGKDYYDFSFGLKAALRQSPHTILVGEIRDRETMEVAITAGETGHLVLTSLHTINASQTINRILGMFDKDEEALMRQRLADSLRWVVSQRLVPRLDGGLHLVTEVMGNNLRSREVIIAGESEKHNLHDIIESSVTPWGWHSFEQSLLNAVLGGDISPETAFHYANHKNQMQQALDKFTAGRVAAPVHKMSDPAALDEKLALAETPA